MAFLFEFNTQIYIYMLNEFISGAIAIFNYLCEQNAVLLNWRKRKMIEKIHRFANNLS